MMLNVFSKGLFTPSRAIKHVMLMWHGRGVWTKQSPDLMSILSMMSHVRRMKGPVVKLAQLAGMIPDLLPSPVADVLRELCTKGDPMSSSMVNRLMGLAWGKSWHTRVAQWGHQSVANASFGQVHRAVLHDGTAVAVKIQYPNMRQAVSTDLALIYRLWTMIDGGAVDWSSFQTEWMTRLYEELDYTLEARRTEQWRQWWLSHQGMMIPSVVEDLSTATVLTTTWMNGVPLEDVKDPHQKKRMGQILLLTWAKPFFEAGMLHGDPHQGNFLWDQEHQRLGMLDFGCTRTFSPHFVQAFCHLYQGILHQRTEESAWAYQLMGFGTLSKGAMVALNQWACFLLRPVLCDQEISLTDVTSFQQARTLLIQLHQAFAQGGGVSLPPEFLLLDRSIVLLGSLCVRLGLSLNWHRLWHPFFENFDPQACDDQQQYFLDV